MISTPIPAIAPQSGQLFIAYVELSLAQRWKENCKIHEIEQIVASIQEHGFRDAPIWDSNLNEGRGGIVGGNGRIEALWHMKNNGKPVPKFIGTDADGNWYVPIQFGGDAESIEAAQAFAIDHNNLTLAGFNALEKRRLWDGEKYLKLLKTLEVKQQRPVSVSAEDLKKYLTMAQSVNPQMADKPEGEGDREPDEDAKDRKQAKADAKQAVENAAKGFDEDVREELAALAGYKTAIARHEISIPMQYYAEHNLLAGDVLDYGGGQDPHDFAKYDPAYAPDYRKLKRQWDTITCNCVLNVLPLEHNRVELLLTIKALLKPEGQALIAIWSKDTEDVLTRSGYQCGWTREAWHDFMRQFWDVEPLHTQQFWGWRLTI